MLQKYLKTRRTNANCTILQPCQTELTDAISFSKSKYFKRLGDKRNNPTTSSKMHWSKIKSLVD